MGSQRCLWRIEHGIRGSNIDWHKLVVVIIQQLWLEYATFVAYPWRPVDVGTE